MLLDFIKRKGKTQITNNTQKSVRTLFIGCIDPRVCIEEIFGLDKEAFIYRTKANIISASSLEVLSMLEFLIEEQNLENIIVCGHYDCKGVEAAISLKQSSSYCNRWLNQIKTTYDKYLNDFKKLPKIDILKKLCLLNTKQQMQNILCTDPVQKALKNNKKIVIEGCMYDPNTNKIEII